MPYLVIRTDEPNPRLDGDDLAGEANDPRTGTTGRPRLLSPALSARDSFEKFGVLTRPFLVPLAKTGEVGIPLQYIGLDVQPTRLRVADTVLRQTESRGNVFDAQSGALACLLQPRSQSNVAYAILNPHPMLFRQPEDLFLTKLAEDW